MASTDDLHRLLIEEEVGLRSGITILRGVDLMTRDIVPQNEAARRADAGRA